MDVSPSALGEQLYDAITLIDEHQCFELIEASADPNFRKLLDDDNQIYSSIGFDPKSKIERDWTCLHVAVECNVLSVVTMLLDNGAKVENKDQKGNTPLHWAAIRGRFDCIDELLKHNASVTVPNTRTHYHHYQYQLTYYERFLVV